ncbi:hypothetical protein RHSIM_Rhsim08G0164000 [Rhododendron simsii]|uniref:Smr domain-containing protein n=1 Tax=Rhododendron simsii TaxID=118357 RepID=A0A834LGR2_RHOSS|nr:hypothetical protein RHSIM_Rhsim08G0164000 [Rhododendron simsii]
MKAKAKARMKQLVFNSNAVVVEQGKYSYEVETLINKISSLPPRGSIARCLEVFKNKLSQNDFALVFKFVVFSCNLDNGGGHQWRSYDGPPSSSNPGSNPRASGYGSEWWVAVAAVMVFGVEWWLWLSGTCGGMEFAARGDWQRSLRLFKYIQRHMWCKPNEHIYTIIIGLLGREGLLEKCREVFEEMPKQGVPRSVFSFTSIINAYGRNGQFKTSLELLERMKKERVSPSILTYNTVINACARGGYDWEGLLGLFAEMRHEGIQPDLVTYNTLLSACASRGLGDEAEMVFRTMNEGGVLPDITTYSYLVETFAKLGRLEKVSELLKEMEIGGNLPEASSYNVLLEAYAHSASIKEAMGVFGQMQEAGCTPNAATYRILLNLFGRRGRYDDVRELFLQMKVSNTEPDVATYNILIQVFGEGGYFKEVVILFHDMVEENLEPNMETYEGLIFACGKGGLHEDAKKILLHMNDKMLVPSSKVYTGVIEAYGQAALYEEALVAFYTMNEVGSEPTIETFNTLIHAFARGGLYKECEAILRRMGECGITRDRESFHGIIEGFKQGGHFEEAIKAYVEMENAGYDPEEGTLEAVLSVYCFAGLVDESEEQFREIKALGVLPSVMCYCMMLGVYAKGNRWDDAHKLLDEMITKRSSNIHNVIGQMIRGDFDDGSNWQMVEYVFDKLNSEGCGLGTRFYNTLIEALWWLGQKERAARVLNEATKRGLFPELFRMNKLVWSVDVHRMWTGGACTAISIWLNRMYEMFKMGEDLPPLATVVVVRGHMEKSSITRDFPVAKAAYSFLNDSVSSSFCYPGWNKGRIMCQRPQLKKILSAAEGSPEGSENVKLITSSNSPFPRLGTRTPRSDVRRDEHGSADIETRVRMATELVTSTV